MVHFGQGQAVTIGEVVERCQAVTGLQARVETDEARVRPANSEVELLLCNPAKAQRLLGWQPQVSLDEGLTRTADYIRSHLSAYRSDRYAV